MARKKHHGGGGKSLQKTAFKLIRTGALVAPGVTRAYAWRAHPETAIKAGLLCYAGINTENQFDMGLLTQSWTPFVAATGATYLIPKLAALIRRL